MSAALPVAVEPPPRVGGPAGTLVRCVPRRNVAAGRIPVAAPPRGFAGMSVRDGSVMHMHMHVAVADSVPVPV